MKSKGFTLAEMLAVVTIIALFGLVGIIAVDSIIKRGTNDAYKAQISEIKTAAENLIKIDGEPSWCSGESTCFVSLRYLAYKKHIKLNDNGEYLNPKTDKPFSLEMVVLVSKYGSNYVFKAYETFENLDSERPELVTKAKKNVVAAAASIYKSKNYCENNCTLTTSDLVLKDLLTEGFYSEVQIRVNENGQVQVG